MPAVLEPPTRTASPAPTARPTVLEQVRQLPGDQQEAIFFFLLRELLRDAAPAEMIPLADGPETLAYLLTPAGAKAQFDRFGPALTAEDRAEIRRRIENPGRMLTKEELLASLDAVDPIPAEPR